jgi:carboxyl-terminal processing protease
MKSKVFVWTLPLVAAAIFWTGFQTARDDDFYAMRKNFELFGGVYEQVVSSYMVRVDPERFMRTGMDAMLETLDPWTDFLDEADNAAMELRSQSGFGEVVINLGNRGGRVTVLAPDSEVGAYRQGIRAGDAIAVVAGQPADSLTMSDVRSLLRGEPGTTVSVTVERSGTGSLDFNLKREAPVVRYVSFAARVEGTNVALVRLDAFGPGATNEIDNALEDLSRSGPLDGMILDLRDNPGGLVVESINLVGLFVPKGTPVVSTRGRAPESNRLYSTSEEPDWGDLDLTLLVNRGSASASEIVSGALQDLDRAVIIGEPTFGKGLVQVVRPMPYHTAMKITFSRYFTPAGRGIRKDALEANGQPMKSFRTTNGRTVREGNGVEPDVSRESPTESDLEKALIREAAFFRFAGEFALTRGDEIGAAIRASGNLQLPDDAMDEFRDWLRRDGFSFTTQLDEKLDGLESLAGRPDAADPMRQLRLISAQMQEEMFSAADGRMRARLTDELAIRVLEPDERARLFLRADQAVGDAVAILNGPRYESLLGN